MLHDVLRLIHLLCAMCFGGAIITEVLALGPLRHVVSQSEFTRMEYLLFRRIRRSYPPIVVALFATGFVMYAQFLGAAGGWGPFLDTSFGLLLTVKMGLALGLAAIFLSAPFVFMPGAATGLRGRLRHFLLISGSDRDFVSARFAAVHYLAFLLVISIVVLARLIYMI